MAIIELNSTNFEPIFVFFVVFCISAHSIEKWKERICILIGYRFRKNKKHFQFRYQYAIIEMNARRNGRKKCLPNKLFKQKWFFVFLFLFCFATALFRKKSCPKTKEQARVHLIFLVGIQNQPGRAHYLWLWVAFILDVHKRKLHRADACWKQCTRAWFAICSARKHLALRKCIRIFLYPFIFLWLTLICGIRNYRLFFAWAFIAIRQWNEKNWKELMHRSIHRCFFHFYTFVGIRCAEFLVGWVENASRSCLLCGFAALFSQRT